MDLLSDVLLSLKVESSAISYFQVAEPWGLDVNGFEPAFCYCVAEGHCWLLPAGKPPVRLEVGDTVLLPRGGRCVIASAPEAPIITAEELWRDRVLPYYSRGHTLAEPLNIHLGGNGEKSHLISLAFSFRDEHHNALLSALPEMVVLSGSSSGTAPWISSAIHFLLDEAPPARPGYVAISTRLAELIFQGLIRSYLLSVSEHPTGWLRGLFDARIGKALSAIHAEPECGWTVESLAATAGMSRSSFAERFLMLVGTPPIEYLTHWRMQLAADLLISSKRSIALIAQATGYQSETAFREAFKRRYKLAPHAYRKQQGRAESR